MDFEQEFEVIPVTRVKITDTEAYSKHPFRVVHNKALEMLAEDIKEHGLLNPILVRVLGFGGRYEILSGHRRMEALKLNGETEADVRIIKCTDIEAANIVIKSNLLQRDKILPSERAKVYMLRNECLKKEKGNLSTGWTKLDENAQKALAKEIDVSKSNIYEYIRLNYLIDDLLISKECQSIIHQYFFVDKKDILNSEYVKEIKKYRNNLTIEILEKITAELGEPKQKSERYVDAFVKKYVGKFHSEQEMADVLEKLLIGYLKDNKLLDKKGGG